jgi:hypothetical protein
MAKFMIVIQLLVQLLPILIEAIKAVEAALPEKGQGQAKAAMIRGTVESAFAAVQNAQVNFEDVWPAIQKMIDVIVATFNTTGIFKK